MRVETKLLRENEFDERTYVYILTPEKKNLNTRYLLQSDEAFIAEMVYNGEGVYDVWLLDEWDYERHEEALAQFLREYSVDGTLTIEDLEKSLANCTLGVGEYHRDGFWVYARECGLNRGEMWLLYWGKEY